MPAEGNKYIAVVKGERLWQGEILSNLIQIRQALDTVGTNDPPKLNEIAHPLAIVLTQDCDLERDHAGRSGARATTFQLPNVLFCEATAAASLRGQVGGSDIWKRVVQNKDERYQCIEAVSADLDAAQQGLHAIGVDFTRYFTIPTDEVYKRLDIEQAKRHCRLTTPYAEHLASRFFYFRSRIALPTEHEVPK